VRKETRAQIQARLAREKQAQGGKLPLSKQVAFEKNNAELNGTTSEAIVKLVDEALKFPESPGKELREIRTLAVQASLGFRKLPKAPRNSLSEKQEANRTRVEAIDFYNRACSLLNQLDNRLGFDLWDRETWRKSDTP
jgi:hypothetical protein